MIERAVDVQKMVDGGAPGLALTHLAGTLVAALIAVYAGWPASAPPSSVSR